jgi:hypothetical protein
LTASSRTEDKQKKYLLSNRRQNHFRVSDTHSTLNL